MSHCCKLRYITSTGTENPHIALARNFIRATNAAGNVKRLAVCSLMRATQGNGAPLKSMAAGSSID